MTQRHRGGDARLAGEYLPPVLSCQMTEIEAIDLDALAFQHLPGPALTVRGLLRECS